MVVLKAGFVINVQAFDAFKGDPDRSPLMHVVVPLDPPDAQNPPAALEALEPDLNPGVATDLYRGAAMDVVRAVAASGGDLLINYRHEETLPAGTTVDDPVGRVQELVSTALGETESVRFERQVGSNKSARVGNTVTHLLEREGVQTVGVLEPTAALVGRTEIDGLAMALRRNDVMLGPSLTGDVYVAAFAEPIDFTAVYADRPVATIAEAGVAADLAVGFAPRVPTVASRTGIRGTAAEIIARRAAGTAIPEATAEVLETVDVFR